MKILDHRPELFARSEYNIWLDPYLRQRMLEEHLNPRSDGASRNPESVERTIGFIQSHISPGSSILDLGCGPGLYAEKLCDSGHSVTGIDLNPASVEYASRKRKDIKYICGDYVRHFPEGRYDSALMIYCDFGALTDVEGERVVRNVYRSLNDGGLFIFDFFDHSLTAHRKEGKDWDYAPCGGFWSGEEYLLLTQTFHYPANMAFAYQYNLIAADGNKHFIVWERYFHKGNILGILEKAGFREVRFFGSVCGNNNFTCADEIFAVAKK